MNKSIIFFIVFFLAINIVFALDLPIGMQKLLEYQRQVALSITFLAAFVGGLLSFSSPCGFVVIPTFFSYLFKERKRALFMTAVFSLGMTAAFVLFGIIAGIVGNFFNDYKIFFAMVSGLVMIVFGVMMIINKGFSIFDFKIKHEPNHSWSVFFLGFFFAVGWTPCLGPILGGIIMLVASFGSILKGALLFGAYSLGVALPLMIVAYFSDKYDVSNWFVSRHVAFSFGGKKIHTHLYGIIGGIVLIIIGGIMFFGKGTGFFMNELPKYLPWTMDFFTDANARIIASQFFAGSTANVIGLLFVIASLIIILKSIKSK